MSILERFQFLSDISEIKLSANAKKTNTPFIAILCELNKNLLKLTNLLTPDWYTGPRQMAQQERAYTSYQWNKNAVDDDDDGN